MAEFSGEALYLKFGSTVLSADFRTFNPTESADLLDASAGADVARIYKKRLEDGSASLSMLGQALGTALWDALAPGTEGTLEWGEEGTTAGNPRHYVVALVSSRDKNIPYDGLVEFNAEFQFSGVLTDTVY